MERELIGDMSIFGASVTVTPKITHNPEILVQNWLSIESFEESVQKRLNVKHSRWQGD